MKIYEKKEELFKKWTYLRKLTFSTKDFEIQREIREKEDEFYKKYIFYKNYLRALERLNEREESKGSSNKKTTL